jgi:hypothetical protein
VVAWFLMITVKLWVAEMAVRERRQWLWRSIKFTWVGPRIDLCPSSHFFCTFVVSSTELLLLVFMSYWCSYYSICMILYSILLFHVTINNFRDIVDSIWDHKWWYLTWACCQLPHCHHHH